MKKYYLIILLSFIMNCTTNTFFNYNNKIKEFFENEWKKNIQNFPEFGTYLGDHRYNNKFTNMSIEAINKRNEELTNSYLEIKKINRKKLSDENKLNFDLYLDNLENQIERFIYKEYLIPIDQMGGIHIDLPNLVDVTPFNNYNDYKLYLSRLNKIPTKINQIIKLMELGIKQNIMPPKIVLKSVPEQIKKQYSYKITESPFYKPFLEIPENIKIELKKSIISEGENIINEKIFPAFEKLENFFSNIYLPKARTNIAVSSLPNGKEYYQFLIKHYTTTNLSIKEIHAIGLSEVKRIRKKMNDIILQIKFDGSFNDFLEYLRSDKKFFYEKAEDLLDGYRIICKKADAKLPEFFEKLPRTPYGVKAIPEYQAPSSPTAYYYSPSSDGKRAGYFWANTYQLDTRPKYEMTVLALHEAVPGHHLQIALANELENVPEFRKYSGYTAYVEGWALYAESLGEDMGMYNDPYDKFGQLTYEMWRACRLVIDTGIHAYNWKRKDAIEYLLKNSAKTKHDAEVEIDRYIVWPGQALAYKIGELKIQELKNKVKNIKKDNFDIREFHNLILESGAIPLNILENKINSYYK